MPFTPFHFGPHSCIGLPFYRSIDLVVFLGANIIIDLEPLLVLMNNFNYPLHGYCHTFLIGGLLGALLGIVAYLFRNIINSVNHRLCRWTNRV